ncbi:MAG: TonB-dependent receptor [Bacteroidales bacterium]|nr:TonB-dependent receptor [Bacteroidales bacterium]
MKKHLLFLLLFFLFPGCLFSQTTLINGRVLNEKSTPVSYAMITLNRDGKTLTGAISDSLGCFQIKGTFTGTYLLKIASSECELRQVEVECGQQPSLTLGNVILQNNALSEVTIIGDSPTTAPEITAENIRMITTGNMSEGTGSVLEILKSTSSVTVDNDENVAIRGNSNVLILMDGIPTTVSSLSAIPAANVNPDAKYDAEGTGGIINIVSEKQLDNAFSMLASFNYGFMGMLNGNFAIGYDKGKWSVRVNYNGKYEKDVINSELDRYFYTTGNSIHQQILAHRKNSNHVVGANVVYRATPKDILTVNVKGMFPHLNNFQNFNNHYITDDVPSELFRQTDITFNREMVEGFVNYKHIFIPKKRTLDLRASVSKIWGHRPSYYYEHGEMVQKSVSGGSPFITSLQADFMTKLKKGQLDAGVKMTYRQNNIDHKFYALDTLSQVWIYSDYFSNDLRHREYIPAAYALYSIQFNPKWSLKAGLRGEFTRTELHCDKDSINTAQNHTFVGATVGATYKINDKWSMFFNYADRVSRPTYPQLNPYINLIDNQTYETGNIYLHPEAAHKRDVAYAFNTKKVKINGSLYLNFVQSCITQVATIRDSALMLTYVNGDWDLKVGLDHAFTFNLLKWFNIVLSTNTYYGITTGEFEGADLRNQGWVNNSNIALNFKPIKGMNIQLQYFCFTPQHFPQFTTRTIHYMNIGIKQSFLKNKLTVSALLTDVFNTRRWDIVSDNNIYSLVNNSKNKSRMFWLGVTFNFNSFKPALSKQKQEEDRSVIRIGE